MASTDDRLTLGRQIINSSAWSVGTHLVVRFIGLISTLILARLLVPADFGLIALASLVIAAVEMLSTFSFEIWIIHHQSPQPSHYSTVWTLSVLRGLFNALILLLTAQMVSDFFAEPRLFHLLMVLAGAILIEAFHNIGVVDFRKHLLFEKEFVYIAACKLAGFLVTVSLAVMTGSYWALVAGIVTSKLVALILSYVMHPFRPWFTLRHWREVFSFAKWLLAGNLVSFLYQRSDTFILGRLSNTQTIGIYSVAFEIVELISTAVLMPIRKVLLPGYSKMNSDMVQLREGFLDGLGVMLLFGVPAAAGIGLVADPLVRIALGEQWLEAIPLIQALSIYSIASVGFANQGPCLIAMGRLRLLSTMLGLGVLVLVPSFIWATQRYGVFGGAVALGLTNSVLFLAGLMATLKVLGLGVGEAWQRMWRTVISTLTMAVVLIALQPGIAIQGWWTVTELLFLIVLGTTLYLVTIAILWRLSGYPGGAERMAIDFIRLRWREARA